MSEPTEAQIDAALAEIDDQLCPIDAQPLEREDDLDELGWHSWYFCTNRDQRGVHIWKFERGSQEILDRQAVADELESQSPSMLRESARSISSRRW